MAVPTICEREPGYCDGSYSGDGMGHWGGNTLDVPSEWAVRGTIPTELGQHTQMRGELNLNNNIMTGTLPTQLGRLTNLSAL